MKTSHAASAAAIGAAARAVVPRGDIRRARRRPVLLRPRRSASPRSCSGSSTTTRRPRPARRPGTCARRCARRGRDRSSCDRHNDVFFFFPVGGVAEWVVDGNNVVGSAPRRLVARPARRAKRRLVERLERFAAARDVPVTVVFDGRAIDAGGGERVAGRLRLARRPQRRRRRHRRARRAPPRPRVADRRDLRPRAGRRVRTAGAQVVGAGTSWPARRR